MAMKMQAQRLIRVVSAVVIDNDRYLITQRQAGAVLPLLWEFPGGRVEDGESDAAALARELRHRLGVQAQIGVLLTDTMRSYQDYCVHLHLYRCQLGPVAPRPLMVRNMAWVRLDEFAGYHFPAADKGAMDMLLFGGPTGH